MASTAELPDFFALVNAAESDMRRVYDHALIVYDYLSSADPITDDQQYALNWPAGELVEAGRNLREHCDAMYKAAILYSRADQPKAMVDAEPFVDPSTLSIDQAFSLFDALGTINSVTSGLMCQPRFRGDGPGTLNVAGEVLDRLQAAVDDARETIRLAVLARKATDKNDLAQQVHFAAEEWVDGSCEPGPALKGLTTALSDLGKAVAK